MLPDFSPDYLHIEQDLVQKFIPMFWPIFNLVPSLVEFLIFSRFNFVEMVVDGR